jgi:hypothetical protein
LTRIPLETQWQLPERFGQARRSGRIDRDDRRVRVCLYVLPDDPGEGPDTDRYQRRKEDHLLQEPLPEPRTSRDLIHAAHTASCDWCSADLLVDTRIARSHSA